MLNYFLTIYLTWLYVVRKVSGIGTNHATHSWTFPYTGNASLAGPELGKVTLFLKLDWLSPRLQTAYAVVSSISGYLGYYPDILKQQRPIMGRSNNRTLHTGSPFVCISPPSENNWKHDAINLGTLQTTYYVVWSVRKPIYAWSVRLAHRSAVCIEKCFNRSDTFACNATLPTMRTSTCKYLKTDFKGSISRRLNPWNRFSGQHFCLFIWNVQCKQGS